MRLVLTVLMMMSALAGAAQPNDGALVPDRSITSYAETRWAPGAVVDVVRDKGRAVFDCVVPEFQHGRGRTVVVEWPTINLTKQNNSVVYDEVDALDMIDALPCPKGTVRVRSVTASDISLFGSLNAYLERSFDPPSPVYTRAFWSMTDTNNINGGRATINLWNSYVEDPMEHANGQIWIMRGEGANFQSVEAGITEYPAYHATYYPNKPHFFVYSTQDGYLSTGCYDEQCGQWVQLSSTLAPGDTFSSFSTPGGTQFNLRLKYSRDPGNGNWYLYSGGHVIGYYPASLFDRKGLANYGDRFEAGGEVTDYSLPAQPTATDMGSGQHPLSGQCWTYSNYQYTAYIRKLKYQPSSTMVFAKALTGTIAASSPYCYDIVACNQTGDPTWGRHIYYGGEGRDNFYCQ